MNLHLGKDRSFARPGGVLATLAQTKKCQQLGQTYSWKGLSKPFSYRGHVL